MLSFHLGIAQPGAIDQNSINGRGAICNVINSSCLQNNTFIALLSLQRLKVNILVSTAILKETQINKDVICRRDSFKTYHRDGVTANV